MFISCVGAVVAGGYLLLRRGDTTTGFGLFSAASSSPFTASAACSLLGGGALVSTTPAASHVAKTEMPVTKGRPGEKRGVTAGGRVGNSSVGPQPAMATASSATGAPGLN